MVADAVLVEPVSAPKFPANREINREFRQIRLLGAILPADTRANSEACREIPYATEQGIFAKGTGNLHPRTGNRGAIVGERFQDDVFGRHRRNEIAKSSESAKEEESVTAERTAISISRPSLALSVVVVRQLLAGDAVLLGWSQNFSRRLGLSSKHSLRRHVRLGRRCGDKSLYRIGTPGLR